MASVENQLRDFMVGQGVPWGEAERAARECGRRIKQGAAAGFVGGTLIGVYTANPGALLMGAVAGFGAGAYTLIASPSCEEVRTAASRLADQSFGL